MTPREKSCVLEWPGKGFLKSKCMTNTIMMRMRQLLQHREKGHSRTADAQAPNGKESAQHGPSRLEENDRRCGQGGRAQWRLGFILKARRSHHRIWGKRAGMATVLREIKLNHETV